MTVASELKKMGLLYTKLELGEVHFVKPIKKKERKLLKKNLQEYGLKLMIDKKAILVEKIVAIIVKMIHKSDEMPEVSFSIFLTNELNEDYHYLSALFSKTKGITIEHFIILHKIERVKELITYDELSLTEIAYKMHYYSMAHLSNQFKKVTGFSPSFFKNLNVKKRIAIDKI
jgi:YesN/AraC family two-component response regulator